jgi:hypothetical protein
VQLGHALKLQCSPKISQCREGAAIISFRERACEQVPEAGKHTWILFRRAGVFYCEDTTTGKQLSLRTKDEGEANTLLHAKNESFRQPVLNLQIART